MQQSERLTEEDLALLTDAEFDLRVLGALKPEMPKALLAWALSRLLDVYANQALRIATKDTEKGDG